MAPTALFPEDMSRQGSTNSMYSEMSRQFSSGQTERTASSQGLPSPPNGTYAVNDDPTVIVGMACRLPGADNVSGLWENIQKKRDLQSKMPKDRFNVDAFFHPQGTNKSTTNATKGYFIDGIDQFDPTFFGISGKEAEAMDPQQRLTLEVVYEALEKAGITLDDVSGTNTAVYCGSFTNDYLAMTTKDLEHYPKYAVTGTANSILSNRISFCYNLHGPCMTVDTACSSSLVCFHLGNKSVQSGESDMAIVVGSALHFDPNIYIYMSDFGMLSTDGRCRAFDEAGSGYVRGEGICAAILKRRSAAEAAGDHIHAVVRGTGANHDGTKEGITLPHGPSQADLLEQTYKNAGISPADTHYFEAHGTGTQAGDPRETKAIGSVFGPGRKEPLWVGSVKTNLGHLEGASGLAGIFKATLSVEKGMILPNMHFNNPNPKIDFEAFNIRVPTELMKWESATGIRRASVNSFGYGGSNAHVIIENYRCEVPPVNQVFPLSQSVVPTRPYLIPLTSHSDSAANKLVEKLGDYIESQPNLHAADLAYSMSSRRTMQKTRSFAIGHDVAAISQDMTSPKPVAAWKKREDKKPRIGFVFTGQGAQWYAMGRQLIEESTLFRQTLMRCDKILSTLPDAPKWSCVDELLKSKEESQIAKSIYSQPLCAALQLALVDLLRAWGVKPSAVIGHSSGEIGAAYAAGVLSFESTIICAYYRGLYMSKGVGASESVQGAMMAVGMTETEGRRCLKDFEGRICLACINSPSSLTLSGDEDAIDELKVILDEKKTFARKLKVEQAFHSHHMYPLAPAFEKALSTTPCFQPHKATTPMFSSVTARDSDARRMDAQYWAANMTGVVRFSDALAGMLLNDNEEQQVDVLVEIGPHPALKGPAKQTMQMLKMNVPYFGAIARTEPAYESILTLAGQLFSLGYPVDLTSVNSEHYLAEDSLPYAIPLGKKLDNLPSYAWDHNRYWAETRYIKEHRQRTHRHSVLGAPVPGAPGNRPRWRNYLRQEEIPWLASHKIDGNVVFPAAGYICMATEAIATLVPDFKEIAFRDIVFKSALAVSNSAEGTEVMLDLEPAATSSRKSSSTWYRFEICSYDGDYRTIDHCHGLISARRGSPSVLRTLPETESLVSLQANTNKTHQRTRYYNNLETLGLGYGEHFRLLSSNIESGAGLSVASLEYKPTDVVSYPGDACVVHPSVLDSSMHVVFAAIENCLGRPMDEGFVATFCRELTISGLLQERKHNLDAQQFWVKANTTLPGARVSKSNVSIQQAGSNDVLVDFKGVEMTALGNADSGAPKRQLYFRNKWMQAFEYLGANSTVADVTELLDICAHQYPNAKILHVTSDREATASVLQKLGGSNGQARRFQSITVVPQSKEQVDKFAQLEADYAGLVNFEAGEDDVYDVIVASRASTEDFEGRLADGGFLIADGVNYEAKTLQPAFTAGHFKVWQAAKTVDDTSKPLAVLTGSVPSSKTEAIVSAVKAVYKGDVAVITIDALLRTTDTYARILSLASLDDDFLTNAAKEVEHFTAVQKAITACTKNATWVLNGATHEAANPTQALILGLARSARSENEKLRLVVLDLEPEFEPKAASQHILTVLSSVGTEDEFAVRNNKILIPRLEADDFLNKKLPFAANRQPQLEKFVQERKLALKIGKVGLIDSLRFDDDEDVLDCELAGDDVEIEVKASALSLRDVAIATGAVDDSHLGDECSGVVTKIGANVQGFQVGDNVVAWRPGCGAHKSIVRNPAACTINVGNMDLATAAASFLSLTTAYYSLFDVAHLQAGEYCLIHAAANSVGQMAIQLVKNAGAIPIVTVASESERAHLIEKFTLPENVVLSSTDASFADAVLSLTDGRGCDVALNSLSGELLQATWECIAPFGRHIEIGTKNIADNGKLDMAPFQNNITCAAVDMSKIFQLNKTLGGKLLQTAFGLLQDGQVTPPGPVTQFPYAKAKDAFRTLQSGDVVGSIVLVPSKDDVVPVMPPTYRNQDLFQPTKNYLIVGGLEGTERALAEWTVRRGARKLTFLSPSGANVPAAKTIIDWLQARQIAVTWVTADVVDRKAVVDCVKSISQDLAGIFQYTPEAHNVAFNKMTAQEWNESVRPTIVGTKYLHEATLGLNLDFFVCFSSFAGVKGSKGQASFAAANTYLDALMSHRRERGLPGTALDLGVVASIGFTESESTETQEDDVISENEFLYAVEEAVLAAPATAFQGTADEHQIVTGVNLTKKDLYWANKSLFRNLYANHDIEADGAKAGGAQNIVAQVKAATTPEERKELLTQAFIDKIATVLAVPTNLIQPGNALSMYGLDSIVAVEFRKWFSKDLSAELALFDIMSSPSISAIVDKACGLMSTAAASKKTEAKAEDKVEVVVVDDAAAPADTLVIPELPEEIPMSTYQERIYFMHNMLEHSSDLNCSLICHIDGTPDFPALKSALLEMAMRNESFITSYTEGMDYSIQEVLTAPNFRIEYEDFASDADPSLSLKNLMNKERAIPMDLEGGEVIRVALVKMGEEQHIMLVTVHHIALDNASLKPFFSQTVALYDEFRAGKAITPAAPKLTYKEFTMWHQEQLQVPEMKADIEWWRDNMKGNDHPMKLLPFAQSERPERAGRQRSALRTNLEPQLLKRMKRLSTRAEATTFQFLLASFRAFVHRYTQEDDLTILAYSGSRPHSAVEDIIGMFVNTVPLRFRNGCDTSFDKLLADVKDVALQGFARNQVPFDTIVGVANVDKGANYFPLGQIAINYQMYGKSPRYEAQDFAIHEVTIEDIPTGCEMSLEATENPEVGLELRFEYDSELYADADMERFFDNFMTFMTSAIKDFRQPIDEIEMCGPKELQYLSANHWSTDFTPNKWNNQPVMSRIADIAAENPQKIAIESSDGVSVKFGELYSRATRVAQTLRENGVTRGQFVSILSDPSDQAITAMLAAAHLCCGYLALDPSSPKGRLSYMVEDSRSPVILIGDGMESLAAELTANLEPKPKQISIKTAAKNQVAATQLQPMPGDPFYSVYTSGSTGKPKGVIVTHENMQAMLSSHNALHEFSPADKILSHSSMSWDISVVQIWSPMTCGATMALAAPETRKDPIKLGAFIKDAKVTATYFAPTHMALILEHNSEDLRQCTSWRKALFIGEALPHHLVQNFYGLGIPADIYNQYGPSETCAQTTYYKVPRDLAESNTGIPIGKPFANCPHYVVNPICRPVPAYVAGELCVGGAQVGGGYINRPDATEKAFVPDCFAPYTFHLQGWTKLYRTGDNARFLGDGNLEFRGRISGDSQIKLRGHRIELSEIENELRLAGKALDIKLGGVACVARNVAEKTSDMIDERRIIAFLTVADDDAATRPAKVTALHAEIGKVLNEYMLPSGYQFLSTLPFLPSGKLDLKALHAMDLTPVYPGRETEEVEVIEEGDVDQEKMAVIIEEMRAVLKIAKDTPIGPDDSFFSLGGQSILLLRLNSRLNRKFGKSVALKDLFARATPAGMTSVLFGGSTKGGSGSSAVVEKQINWDEELAMINDPKYAVKSGLPPVPQSEVKNILMTGDPSLNSAFMLSALLSASPSTTIYVLGTEKPVQLLPLFKELCHWQLVDESILNSRIRLIPGCMASPRLGLSEDQFQELANKIDAIYHMGGHVSLIKSYPDLKRTNVLAMLDLIEMAVSGARPAYFTYLSTWSVLHLQRGASTSRAEIAPTHFRPGTDENQGGYIKTRWMSEMLLHHAAAKGLPTKVIRSSGITSPPSGPIPTPADNWTVNMIVDMVKHGIVPDMTKDVSFCVDMVPADYLMNTVVRLGSAEEPQGLARAHWLHVTNPTPVTLQQLTKLMPKLRSDGAQGKVVSYEKWVELVDAKATTDEAKVEAMATKSMMDDGKHIMFSPVTTETDAKLQGLTKKDGKAFVCPPMNEQYLRALINKNA